MGLSYVWNTSIPGFIGTNAAGDTAYVNPTVTTSYPVQIDFGTIGIQYDTAIVIVMPFLDPSAIVTNEICVDSADGAIEISTAAGQAPFTYSIIGPGLNTNNQTGLFENLAAGIYTIDVVDDFGCTDQIIVTVDPGPFCSAFQLI